MNAIQASSLPMYNPISFVGIPKELRSTFFHQLRAFGEALKEIHKRVSPLDEDWELSVQAFVTQCEESFGLASRDIRLVLERLENPDMGVRVCTNLVISILGKLISEIGAQSSATRLLASIDDLISHDMPIPSGLICRSNAGNFPFPLDLTGWLIQAQEIGGIWVCYSELTLAAAAAIIPPATKPTPPVILTGSQQSALERIRNLFKIRRADKESVAGVWSRPFPLVCGISGSGKTTIVKRLALEENVPCVVVDSGAWIVRGSRNEHHTLIEIRDSVRASPNGGVVLVDELDKFCGSESAWDRSVVQELMALMDGRLTSSGWTEADLAKFKQWMIVGGATFQADIRAGSKSLGFQDTPDYGGVVSEVLRAQTLIPSELVARFNCRWVALEPPAYEDFSRQVRAIVNELNYEPEEGIERHIHRTALDAVASAQNMRFIEAYLSELLEDMILSDATFLELSADDYLPLAIDYEDECELI